MVNGTWLRTTFPGIPQFDKNLSEAVRALDAVYTQTGQMLGACSKEKTCWTRTSEIVGTVLMDVMRIIFAFTHAVERTHVEGCLNNSVCIDEIAVFEKESVDAYLKGRSILRDFGYTYSIPS